MNTRVIVILIGLVVCQTRADFQEDAWQEPNAWERHSPSVLTPYTCPVCDVADDGALAVFYYKKLVAYLFNKNTLKKDEQTGHLQKGVIFSLSPAQMAIIESSTDIRDLDAVITIILASSKSPPICTQGRSEGTSFIWLLKDISMDLFQILQIALSSSEMRFMCFVLGVVMLICFIHKRYNRSLIAVVIFLFLLFGYFFTYLECNRKLEAEDVISLVRESEPEADGWLRRTFNILFYSSKQDKQIVNIQKQTKIKLPFCRPDHVLMIYVNDMFLNQFQLIVEKCMEMIMSFKNSLSFPYNIIAIILLPILFGFIIKLMFEHVLSPVVWYRAMRGDNTQQQQLPQSTSNDDKISGDNLRILLESIGSSKLNTQSQLPSSGVQEILEPLEAASNSIDDQSTSEDDVKSNSNVTISDIEYDEKKAKKER